MKNILIIGTIIFSILAQSQPITGGSGTGPSRPLVIMSLHQFLLTPEYKKNESVYKKIIENEKKLISLVGEAKIKTNPFLLNNKPENLVEALLLISLSDSVGRTSEDEDCVTCNQSQKTKSIKNKEMRKVLKEISEDPALTPYLKIRFQLEGASAINIKMNIDKVLSEE